MEVRYEPHAPAALPPVTEAPTTLNRRLGGAPELVGTFRSKGKSVVFSGIRIPDPPARNLVTILTELSRMSHKEEEKLKFEPYW